MRPTPEIPDRFRRFRFPGYTNVFSLLPDCKRFYCTETLFGDWDAQTLILAKDAAPTAVIRSRAESEGERAWRHSERAKGDSGGWKTNERVARNAGILPGSQLYGSATANMLCDLDGWSRNLPGYRKGDLHDYLCDALGWVITSMPNLRAISCIGVDAWFLVSAVLNRRDAIRSAREYRENERLLHGEYRDRSLVASCHLHPSRGSREQWALGWNSLAEYLRGPSGSVADWERGRAA